MKIAIVYNRVSQRVINLFGIPNREKYGLAAIKRISDALKKGGHSVKAFEGDKDLIDHLEEFMPRVLKGERPGMVFNLSYGIQGQARYTHVPAMLEMVGIPYVGSGPLAHSLALDKVVAKMIFRQHGLPTPDFAVLPEPGFETPELTYPLIVKPKNEAVSFGIKVVNNEEELREAAGVIFEQFQQPVLVEQFIAGREINVGLLGNDGNLDVFPPVEIVFGKEGPQIYTMEDKQGKSGREVGLECPANIGEEVTQRAQDVARGAFRALQCADCARVDMRLDDQGNVYLLEINSLPSLGRRGSYVVGAEHVGLDFSALANRLVEVASVRYFGTPHPPPLSTKEAGAANIAFSFISGRRDKLEDRIRRWTQLSSRTEDPVGIRSAYKQISGVLSDVSMRPVPALTDDKFVWTWETAAGLDDGTLLIAPLDVPLSLREPTQVFRREPEWLFGEGVGSSRAPLGMTEYVLRSLQAARTLKKCRLGVLLYADEGADNRYSDQLIPQAATRAARVLVLRPGNIGDKVITERRGLRKYRLIVEGPSRRLDKTINKPDPFRWVSKQLDAVSSLSAIDEDKRLSVGATEVHTASFPLLLPHRVTATLLMTYSKTSVADEAEAQMKELLTTRLFETGLELVSDRPPLVRSKANLGLARKLQKLAEKYEIPLGQESSAWPSAAGLIPPEVPVLCGVGPVCRDLYTPQESVSRTSVVQRALLVSQLLLQQE